MALFKIIGKKIQPVGEKKIDLEHDVQKLTEENLESIFGLKFISGSLNQELSVKVQEQEFYIDTLAFNESQKSFVIIEYKKDQSFSVIDQGYAYLAAMVNNKAEFVLELNKRLGRNLGKQDIDWEQSRVIFVSTEFTNYQVNAINFKDLPIFLYKIRIYEDNLIEFDAIKPYKTTESIKKFSQDKTIQKVSREIKVYTSEDLIKPEWTVTRELYELLKGAITSLNPQTSETITKYYFAYKLLQKGQWYSFVEVQPQASGLIVYLRPKVHEFDDPKRILEDCSKIGHWANGDTKFKFISTADINYAFSLIQQAYKKFYK